MRFQSLLLMSLFFQYELLSEPIGKDRKISQYNVGNAPPSCFGTSHMTTPPRKTEYAGVPQHRCSCALDLCSACPD